VLFDVEERTSDQGQDKYYKFLVIDDERTGQLLGVPAWHQGLKAKMAALEPQIGERIRITVGERIKLADGRPFVKYDLKVDRQQPLRVDYSKEKESTGAAGAFLTQTGDVVELPPARPVVPTSPFDAEPSDDLPF
jgi:hypothetical protein